MLPPKKPSNINASDDPGSNKLGNKNTRISALGAIGGSDPSLQKSTPNTTTAAGKSLTNVDDPLSNRGSIKNVRASSTGATTQNDPLLKKSTSVNPTASGRSLYNLTDPTLERQVNRNTRTTNLGSISENDPYLHKSKPRINPQTATNTQNTNQPSIENKKLHGTAANNVIDEPLHRQVKHSPIQSTQASSISNYNTTNQQPKNNTATTINKIDDRDPYLWKSIPRNTPNTNNIDSKQSVQVKNDTTNTLGYKNSSIQQVDPALHKSTKNIHETAKSTSIEDANLNRLNTPTTVSKINSIRDDDPYLHKSTPRTNQVNNSTGEQNSEKIIQESTTPSATKIRAIDEANLQTRFVPRSTQLINNPQNTSDPIYSTTHNKNITVSKINTIDDGDPYLLKSRTRINTDINQDTNIISTLEQNTQPDVTGIVGNINNNNIINTVYPGSNDRKIVTGTKNSIGKISSTDDPAINQLRNYSFNGNIDELRSIRTTSNSTNPSTQILRTDGVTAPTTTTSSGPNYLGTNGELITTGTIESVVTTTDGTVIVYTDKDVTVNTFEEVVEQRYITNNLGTDTLGVGLAVGDQYSGVVDPVIKLGFDSNYFTISQIGTEVAKISLTAISSGSGYSGISGWSGWSGFSGTTGAPGVSGYSGEMGPPGAPGVSGYSGETGSTGFSGYSGEMGPPGAPGASGYSGETGSTGFSGFSGYSGQSFTGDYVSYIQAGTGVSVSGTSGAGGVPIVSIGQPVAITDNVIFQNIHIASGGTLTFEDDIAKAIIAGATIPYSQGTAASKFYTNADALAGYTLTDMKPGDFYYDDVSASIYICIDTGLGYFDLLDLTVRA